MHNPNNPKPLKNILTKAYDCDVCSKQFTNKKEFELHYTEHFESNTCKSCGRQFKTLQHFKLHVFRHHFKTETCTRCGKLFHKRIIEKHMRSHDIQKVITFCEICNKTFGSALSLARHLVKHTTVRCKFCGVHKIKSMEKHLEVRRKGKVQKCSLCCKFVSDIDAHNKNIHKNTQFIFCTMCPEKLTSIAERGAHIQKVHFSTKKCPSCKEQMDIIKLDDHKLVVKSYTNARETMFRMQRRHLCHVRTTLVRRIHHKGNLCGFFGASMAVMRRHCFKYHENETDWVTIKVAKGPNQKPPKRWNFLYKCHCGKPFKYESSLSEHRSKCLLVKPFKCRVCDSRFITKRNLFQHQRKYHIPRVVEEASKKKNLTNAKDCQLKRRAVPSDIVVTYRQRKKALKCKLCDYYCFSSKFMGHHRRTYHDSDNLCLEELNYKPEVERYMCKDYSQEDTKSDVT
ncbi:unnamed protein product [Diabrotica balteata]|uniref:C2H2-type domain-containing protein n=1 Tax=Diabrotica balteata TaxID=107213 RepID=A0A9N9TBS6_DIABA|nr:unnamed protein product [Diabrotica balteata]